MRTKIIDQWFFIFTSELLGVDFLKSRAFQFYSWPIKLENRMKTSNLYVSKSLLRNIALCHGNNTNVWTCPDLELMAIHSCYHLVTSMELCDGHMMSCQYSIHCVLHQKSPHDHGSTKPSVGVEKPQNGKAFCSLSAQYHRNVGPN